MVRLIGQKAMNQIVSHDAEVTAAVHKETAVVEGRADANLQEARGSTKWHKIYGPDGLTSVDASYGDVDGFVNLNAPNAMAIEFGHAPSGVFGPEGKLGHIESKAPEGLYILHRAAGLI